MGRTCVEGHREVYQRMVILLVFITMCSTSIDPKYLPSFFGLDRCVMPLGLEDKRITDGHLTASTYYNHHLSPWHGRLNHRWSWSVRLRRVGQWFQVNFVELMRIKGVATQGRQDANQWVRSYTVSYSIDGMSFVPYKENRRVKVGVKLVKLRVEIIFCTVHVYINSCRCCAFAW